MAQTWEHALLGVCILSIQILFMLWVRLKAQPMSQHQPARTCQMVRVCQCAVSMFLLWMFGALEQLTGSAHSSAVLLAS